MNMQYIPSGMEGLLGVEFFTYVLPWLLTFAIVYGILSHIAGGMPKNKAARSVIALVMAFIVAPFLGPWVEVLMSMIGSLVVLIAGLLVLIVFLEVMGIKKDIITEYDEKGKPKSSGKISIFEAYGTWFAILFVIIGVLVFISSGGLQALGWTVPVEIVYNWPLMFFLAIVALAIWWMSTEPEKK